MIEQPTTAPFPLPIDIAAVVPDRLLSEGNTVTVGAVSFTVLSTPGHTPGSICLLSDDGSTLFTGDTLFAGGWGGLICRVATRICLRAVWRGWSITGRHACVPGPRTGHDDRSGELAADPGSGAEVARREVFWNLPAVGRT